MTVEQLAPATAAFIEGLDITEDGQHLDIASGTVEPGLSIARLSSKGRVALTVLASEMLEVAARQDGAQGMTTSRRRCAARMTGTAVR